ncbi:hypothetical protein N0V85_004307 [Neurospora sp. IMI 360204]|nr:hypothetical protein N0V85_004307 [Neurospora sp. IMI 360204]
MTNLPKSSPEPPPYYPPSIAQQITDRFLSKTSFLQGELAKLSRALGYQVIVEADWQRLLDEYGEQNDPTIVGAAANILEAWSAELGLIVGRAEMDDWLTKLLTRVVEAGGKLRVMLDVWEDTQLGTSWSDERMGFFVHLPKHFLFVRRACKEGFYPLQAVFNKSLPLCSFPATEKEKEDSKPEPGKGAGTATELESGLKQLSVRDEKRKVIAANSKTTTTSSASSAQPKPSQFPTVASLPSLSEICSKPPYHITIQDNSNPIRYSSRKPGWIGIHGSHGSSLKLIDQYISKWIPDVVMESDENPPTIDGVVNGALSMLTVRKRVSGALVARGQSVTVPMVLAIVEGTLGYEVVWQGDGEYRLRRDAPFVYE